MATIAENLDKLIEDVNNSRTAIINKGGVFGLSDGLDDFADAINSIPGPDTPQNVKLVDYDGTVLHTYSKAQFAALESLPAYPTHDGLRGLTWNWSLANAKTYVATYGKLNIGQMYTTSDGKTRLYISLSEGRLSPVLKLYLNANTEVDVDWGDGSSHSTWTTTSAAYKDERHDYEASGDYVIAITVVTGSIILQSSSTSLSTLLTNGNISTSSPDRAYLNSIHKIEIGSNVTSIGNYAFQNCHSLTSITIPNTVTSIGSSAFQYCYGLTSITIPNGVTSIGDSAFNSCYGLTSITIPNTVTSIAGSTFRMCYSLSSITIPNTVTSIGNYAFYNCSSISSITIPNTVTSIGNNAFNSCYALTSITISNGVTSIAGSTFQNCHSLTSITIPNTVTSIGDSAFNSCYGLTSITIPNGVTNIGSSAFQYCYGLTSITIPNGVTNIGSSAFQYCYGLTSITIPNTVTSIGNNAFNSCSSFGYVKFTSTTPPTITNINAWSNLPTDCYILIPYDTLDDYLNGTNMPDDSKYLYLCFATYAEDVVLPTEDSDGYTLTWYASREDARAGTNPITVGNGKEIYARAVAV